MSVIIFIIVLALLILAHEFGHFLFAKIAKMRVDEFGVGFPPKLLSKKFGETTYSLNLIPFGGFVKILGENPNENVQEERSFATKNKFWQILVLAGGVIFNLLTAFLLLTGGFMIGMPTSESSPLISRAPETTFMITAVSPGSPAEKAGLQAGDKIYYVESAGVESQGDELNSESFKNVITGGQGDEVAIAVEKPTGERYMQVVTPSFDVVPNVPAVGLTTDKVGIVKLPFFSAVKEGLLMTGSVFVSVATGLFLLVRDAFVGAADLSQVTGPIGIVGFIDQASTLGIAYLISFVAFISVNLAVINLIPFPALDGGRILFVVVEFIKGKPINPKVANVLNFIGFVALMLLMVVITFNDIVRLL